MNNTTIKTAAIGGFLAVAIGAMGAHGLKPHLTEYQVRIFETGVQFMFYHTLAMLGVGILEAVKGSSRQLRLAGRFFLAGIIGFSGSLFLLACKDLIAFPVGWAGPITPIGGVLFMGGWLMLFLAVRSGK